MSDVSEGPQALKSDPIQYLGRAEIGSPIQSNVSEGGPKSEPMYPGGGFTAESEGV